MVEHQPSKLNTWVRFPSPAFFKKREMHRISRFLQDPVERNDI